MIIIYLLSLIAQIIVFVILPDAYSPTLGIVIMVVYISLSILYMHTIKKWIGIFSFDLFFLVGIYVTTFYRLLGLDELYRGRAYAKLNEYYINKANMLTLIGATVYMLGGVCVFKRYKSFKKSMIMVYDKTLLNIAIIFIVSLFILFILKNGFNFLYAYSSNIDIKSLNDSRSVMDYMKIFLTIAFVQVSIKDRYNSFVELFIKNKILYGISFFMIILLVLGGSRNLPYQIVLMILGSYNFIVRRIKTMNIIIFVIMGIVLSALINVLRSQMYGNATILNASITDFNIFNAKKIFLELGVASAPLYYFVENVSTGAPEYGKGMLFQAISIIPFIQSAVIDLFNINRFDYLPSSMIATIGIFESLDSGIGTHIVGDLYYNFGFFGVVFFMGLLGVIISILTVRVSKNPNAVSLVGYISLFSISFFYARTEYMYPYYYVVNTMIITYFIKSRAYRKQNI